MIAKRRVSLDDVAQRANLSRSTVSLVLNPRNGRIPLTDESIQRVRTAMRELGYKPNVFARGLASGRSRLKSLAVIIPHDRSLVGSIVSQALAGVTEVATLHGYSCTVLSPKSEPGRTLVEHPVFQERLVEGVVALAWDLIHQDALREIQMQQEFPFVVVHSEPTDETIACVTSDDFGNAYKMVEHLYQLGHRRFAFAGGPLTGDAANRRIEGYTRYLIEHGIAVEADTILRGDYAGIDQQHFVNLMKRPQPPTAVVCVSDAAAAKAIVWAREMGLRVPEDVAVTGFDDDPLAAYLSVPLTTIRTTGFHQGELAAQMTLDMIAGKPLRRRRILLPGELLIRESTVIK